MYNDPTRLSRAVFCHFLSAQCHLVVVIVLVGMIIYVDVVVRLGYLGVD